MMRSSLRVALLVLLTSTACDSEQQCVADCGASSGQGGTGSTSSETSTGEASTGPSSALECAQIQEAELAFYESNSSCTTLLDCQGVRADCFPPGVPAACTGIALSATADLDAWAELDARAFEACGESCVFEGDCGSLSYCNDEQRCVQEQAGNVQTCEDFVKRDIDAFLAENAACIDDEDCISVSSCTGGNNECSPVALNTAADMDDWNRLELVYIEACDGYCDTSEGCETQVRCGDSGRCELVP